MVFLATAVWLFRSGAGMADWSRLKLRSGKWRAVPVSKEGRLSDFLNPIRENLRRAFGLSVLEARGAHETRKDIDAHHNVIRAVGAVGLLLSAQVGEV